MSLESATNHLKKYNLDKKIIIFNTSSATVKEASIALNCKEEEIAKTLAFLIEDKPILIVTSGDKKIDNAKYKKEFHIKAKMVPSSDVLNIIGHEVGGVCPFGIKDNITVYLDESLKKYNYIYPACGSHNSAIKLTLKELEKSSNYSKWVDVCKTSEGEK